MAARRNTKIFTHLWYAREAAKAAKPAVQCANHRNASRSAPLTARPANRSSGRSPLSRRSQASVRR